MFLISVEWLDEAKTRARFNLPGREEWRAEHIDALMHALAEIREEMSPAVDPRYRTALHEFSGGTLLAFRHPSLGWLPFLLPSAQRQRIAASFQEQEVQWGLIHTEERRD